jgi:hypothetical protein
MDLSVDGLTVSDDSVLVKDNAYGSLKVILRDSLGEAISGSTFDWLPNLAYPQVKYGGDGIPEYISFAMWPHITLKLTSNGRISIKVDCADNPSESKVDCKITQVRSWVVRNNTRGPASNY